VFDDTKSPDPAISPEEARDGYKVV
jgi:hypothetical protein